MTIQQLLSLLGDNKKYTLHSHTQYCDGHASMEQFAQEAAARGFAVYGFSPHSPLPFDSPCNMSFDSVPEYLAEVERIKAAYPEVKFLCGMEVDYLGPQWGPASQYFKQLPLDFIIGSVHFIPNQEGEYVDIDGRFESFRRKMHEKFRGDLRYVVETFFAQSEKMIAEGGFEIIGHFDKIKHNGGLYQPSLEKEGWYNELVEHLIGSIIASGIIVEINTKAWAEHQQLFPAQRHWRRLIDAGVPIIVNSDAHYPERIDASRQQVAAAIDYLRQRP